MHVVLYQPEIPQNTGNIARTCAATGTDLILVEPLGFSISDKYLKRAGMDYLIRVHMRSVRSFGEVLENAPSGANFYYASTKAPRDHTQVHYGPDDYLVFGSESQGLPENILERAYDKSIRIPMLPDTRSLNLASSVAIVLFEALRQQGFPNLESSGTLTGRPEEAEPWLDLIR